MEELRFLYVCEGLTLTSAMPLVRVDNTKQGDIVINRLKEIYPNIYTRYACMSELLDVPHFSEYIWD